MTAAERPGDARLSIIVNGEPSETSARDLNELLASLDLAGAKVATALNGDFVPAKGRAAAALRAGDRIEIVAPRQGG